MVQVSVIDGIEVHMEGGGEQNIVMIHGWPDTYRLWDRQVAFFGPHYRCVRFTLPGFDITQPRRAFSLDSLVETIKTIVETSCAGRPVILMLHDWGCLFGYEFAARHPLMVSRIVALDVGDATSIAYSRSLSLRKMLTLFGYQLWLAIGWYVGGSLGDRMTKAMARMLKTPGDRRLVSASMNYPYFIRHTGTHGSYADIGRCEPQHPILYCYGTRKPFMFHSPEWLDRLGRRDGCRVVALDAGHWLSVESPGEFNAAAANWLSWDAGSHHRVRAPPARRP